MFFWDPTMILLIPALILAFWAQAKVRGAYAKYSQIRSASGLTGAQVARSILNMNGLQDVVVEEHPGELSDHYDPRSRTVRLSEGVYNYNSVAALGIAAHEVGHAIQHSKGYAPLAFRSLLVKPANIGSWMAFPLFFIGFIFSSMQILMTVGIIFFSAALAFQLVTLPVEFDASRKAIDNLRRSGILEESDVNGARAVLSAAALTYVAAATMALSQLIRLLVLRNMRD